LIRIYQDRRIFRMKKHRIKEYGIKNKKDEEI